jgi:hypothetical protein
LSQHASARGSVGRRPGRRSTHHPTGGEHGGSAGGGRSAPPVSLEAGEIGLLREIEPARKLFARVIEVALEDQRYLEETRTKSELSPRDHRRLRIILAAVPPEDFFNSDWFEHVCELVGIHPQAVRDRL